MALLTRTERGLGTTRCVPRARGFALARVFVLAFILTLVALPAESVPTASAALHPASEASSPPDRSDLSIRYASGYPAIAMLPATARSAVRQLAAWQAAYPERVQRVELRDGDWAIMVADTWFYWAYGRLLPEKAREEWRRYAPQLIEAYVPGPYRVPPVSVGDAAELRELHLQSMHEIPRRHNGFLGLLYGGLSNGQMRPQMRRSRILGFPVRVHPEVYGPLTAVDRELRARMADDPDLRAFVASLSRIDSQNWRWVAGTRSTSRHAYGVALDLIPRSYQGRFSYWRWAAQAGVSEWWDLTAAQRWHPPESVIATFEEHGFIWGGRWTLFDSIHFEYRPEVYALSSQQR